MAIFLSVIGCKESNSDIYYEGENQFLEIYKERNPNLPLILSKPRIHTKNAFSPALSFTDYLGRSFKTNFYPYESMDNIGYPIIDMSKLKVDKPTWVTTKPIKRSRTTSFSYAGFDRYEETSLITEKIRRGFELDLGIFKIGKKKAITKVFSSAIANEEKSIFGQLDVEIIDAVHDILLNSNRITQITLNYLDASFRDDLYNMMPEETFSSYGGFILSNLVTGGRASALYSGYSSHSSSTSAESKEQDMSANIAASFNFKNNEGGGSIGFGFGNGFSDTTSMSQNISQFKLAVVTLGGRYGLSGFTVPQNIDKVTINLSDWANSLNDASTHTMVDIQNDGLTCISDFILEKNLKERFEKLYSGNATNNTHTLTEPIIYIKRQSDPFVGKVIIITLRTRFGDDVVLYGSPEKSIVPSLSNLISEYGSIFDIKFQSNTSTFGYEPGIVKINMNIPENISPAYLKKMRVYTDIANGMTYILSFNDNSKYGFSIYTGNGDYLLDTYGIRNFIKSLPTVNINPYELLNYTLVAL